VPSAQGTPEWPRYRSSDRNVMVFGRNIHVESDPFGTERELWTGVR
jgi:carboxylesterase type B